MSPSGRSMWKPFEGFLIPRLHFSRLSRTGAPVGESRTHALRHRENICALLRLAGRIDKSLHALPLSAAVSSLRLGRSTRALGISSPYSRSFFGPYRVETHGAW
ncbi:MAG TPA: hypothetical protein VFS12_18470, partial [Terriglobia bacterium]|nr:hypothetical protein [Terriglobia bacterium]